jgi:hypothetical protein
MMAAAEGAGPSSMTGSSGWERAASTRGRRGARWVAIILVTFLTLAIAGETLGGPGGPASSSYATGSSGVAAWAELLSRTGRSVSRLRSPLARAHLDPGETLIVLAPDALLRADGARVIAFVRAGGRLIFGGGDPTATLPALVPAGPEWQPSGAVRTYPEAGPAALSGVEEVQTAGEGSWLPADGWSSLLGAGGRPLLLQRAEGHGVIELLADDSPLQNRLLASADNAQLALELPGQRGPVVFAESVHGFGQSRGLAALPGGWLAALVGLAGAGLLWMLARGVRLGPPEPPAEPSAPPRGAFLEALALLLRRAADSEQLQRRLNRRPRS